MCTSIMEPYDWPGTLCETQVKGQQAWTSHLVKFTHFCAGKWNRKEIDNKYFTIVYRTESTWEDIASAEMWRAKWVMIISSSFICCWMIFLLSAVAWFFFCLQLDDLSFICCWMIILLSAVGWCFFYLLLDDFSFICCWMISLLSAFGWFFFYLLLEESLGLL